MRNFLILVFILVSGQTFACSCEEMSGSAKEFLKDADSVFLGVPTQDSVIISVGGEYQSPDVMTNFKVVRNFKAAAAKNITVYSEKGDGANCGVDFKANEGLILIFSYLHEGKLYTNDCSVAGINFNEFSSKLILELL